MKDFVIPAIDLKEGKVVRLFKGDFDRVKVYPSSPQEMAELFQELGFKRIHVVDLEGSLQGVPANLRSIRLIRRAFSGTLQVGGGIRSLKSCQILDKEGVDFFVVGTLALREPQVFEEVLSYFPHRVILAVDAKGGRVAVGGWKDRSSLSPEELASLYEGKPLWGYLYTNIDRDGTLEGVDPQPYLEFKRHFRKPLLASGGVASVEDIRKLVGVVEGVVVGKAIYEGKIRLEELL
ncbi:MAG: 1-(5-phosphoribosyl)-5-[(5-phosphoribosylamino)methylideneamino]imidazole-4-carboxamide isomerase [Aquificaceae bacterium]|nr:1-(5-phosphoribosyl)-5-[(5-phosphoribosylamino)methylideneamino]imidazole-4-carboxamide isomerase [Aquificaceae bacterium]MCX8060511.1 1-(5-phosphoribosyl)-5-[(5-phosphoribosylamino)methylideneamino]imidazole-4-carboxamide isomerase [Aquificaceae bacterium]MDW8096534.1 1-(5-phosphoribosyl)-5-[(5-phosphoribosylamino)methylideneamino]imidazole-4-carboxamide isomerase [Aquificaceae bacterium]